MNYHYVTKNLSLKNSRDVAFRFILGRRIFAILDVFSLQSTTRLPLTGVF